MLRNICRISNTAKKYLVNYHKNNGIFLLKGHLSHITNTNEYLFPSNKVTFADMTVVNQTLEPFDKYNNMQTSNMVLHLELCNALLKLNKISPTIIQYESFSKLMKARHSNLNKDCSNIDRINYNSFLLAGETGCGKTLAYVLPILNTLLHEFDMKTSNAFSPINATHAVIMVPNKELINQLYSVINEIVILLNISRNTSITVDVYNHNAVLEYGTIPHITLCSPAMISSLFDVKLLDNYLFQTQSASNQKKVKGHVQLLNAMQYMIFNDKISHVVLDEADMLMEGGYLAHIARIMEYYRISSKWKRMGRHDEDGAVLHKTDPNRAIFKRNPLFILSAATIPSSGTLSIRRTINTKFPEIQEITNPYFHKHHPKILQCFIRSEKSFASLKFAAGDVLNNRLEQLVKALVNDLPQKVVYSEEIPRTMMQLSKYSSIGAIPDCLILGNCEDQYHYAQESSRMSVETMSPTLIFVNTVANANLLHVLLNSHPRLKALAKQTKNDIIKVYHSECSSGEKMSALTAFRDENNPCFALICTDSIARGVDLPNVTHVIQAEFAENVVNYIHRIGRTARGNIDIGDRVFKVTHFYDEECFPLVAALLSEKFSNSDEIEFGQKNINSNTFSRRRSFKKYIKRREKKYQ